MSYLFYLLVSYLNTASKDDLNYAIAEYILKHADEITATDMNITVLAQNCHVSPASVSRFCRKFGFDDYSHLKSECSHFLTNKITEYQSDLMFKDPMGAAKQMKANMEMQLSSMLSTLDFNQIDAFIYDIFKANTVAIFASHFSHSVAQLLQSNLFSCNQFCLARGDTEGQIKSAEALTKDDIAIVISVRGNYLDYKERKLNQRLAKAIKKSGAKVVYITANQDPQLKKECDQILYISMSTNVYMGGRYLLLSFMEILSSRLITIYNETMRGD